MAYASGFEHDIFISYSHVDNLAGLGEADGWITEFEKYLGIYLSRRVGRLDVIRIWRDDELDGSQQFDDAIRNRISRSALFLAVNSQGYLKSDYCKEELKCFWTKVQQELAGLSVREHSRILNVLVNNVRREDWPEEYGKTAGYPFYEAPNRNELGYPIKKDNPRFEEQLRRLVDAAYLTLTALNEIGAPAVPPQPERTVFLADTADSLSRYRKRLNNELRDAGVRVLQNIPPPHEAAAHEQKAIQEIQRADLSVHLLDDLPGREIDGTPEISYPQKQVEIGLEHAKSQLIWVPQTLDLASVEDETQRTLLDKLENGNRGSSSYCFVRGIPTSISRNILERLDQAITRRANPQATPAAALVDTHLKDQLHAFTLGQYLIKLQVQPYINPEEDNPETNMNILEVRLKQVSRLIIIFGEVAEEWVRARLGIAVQIAVKEQCPLQACGVYFAPPRQRGPDKIFALPFLPVYEFDSRDIDDPNTLRQMMN